LKLASRPVNRGASVDLDWRRHMDFGLLRAAPLSTFTKASCAQHRNKFYVRCETLLACLLPSRDLRILVSSAKPDWRQDIASGFSGIRHTVEFGPITLENAAKYDLVIPLSFADQNEIRGWPSGMSNRIMPIPSEECVRLCDNKYELNLALDDAGFGRYIPKMANGLPLPLPYILKKRVGEWGIDCTMILNRQDERAVLEKLNDPEYFCQEIIPGPFEFATHILFVGDKIMKSLNIMYAFDSEFPIKGQHVNVYRVIHRCSYLKLFRAILRTIGFQGLCCVNYKVANGQPYLLEINPRFGGSLGPFFFSFVRHLR
jgi:ATP-grasp domain